MQCAGEPVRVSVCHCLDCQRRSGSAFSTQARFATKDVTLHGEAATFVRIGDEGRRTTFRFCPRCGSTVAYENEGIDGLTAVPVGLFEGTLPDAPRFSNYELRKLPWVGIAVAAGGEHNP